MKLNITTLQYEYFDIMIRHKLSFLFYFFIFLAFSGCQRKQKPALINGKERLSVRDYLYLRNGKPFGILRIECNDCQMIYTVNHKKFTVDIREGNEDRFIYPKNNSSLNTLIKSNDNQMIRVLAINANGKVVSNVLDTFIRDQQKSVTYNMKYVHNKNTFLVDILKKKHRVAD